MMILKRGVIWLVASENVMTGRTILAGAAQGRIVSTQQALSFWGGVDPATGRVIDAHHPLCGTVLSDAVMLMPTSRGSCSGSGVLLDMMDVRSPVPRTVRRSPPVASSGRATGDDRDVVVGVVAG